MRMDRASTNQRWHRKAEREEMRRAKKGGYKETRREEMVRTNIPVVEGGVAFGVIGQLACMLGEIKGGGDESE